MALGVGSAIACASGVATAEPSTPDVTSSTETGTEPAATTPLDTNPPVAGAQPPAQGSDGVSGTTALPSSPTEPESATASSVEVAPGVVVSHSGGAQTSARSLERAPEPKKSGKSKQDAAPSNAPASAAESSARRASVDSDTTSVTGFSPSVDDSPAPSAKQSSPPPTFAAAMTMNAPSQESPSPKPVAAPPSMVKVVLGALAAAFGANSSGPTQPATSPAAWVVAAVTRRELGDVPAASAENVSLARTAAVTNSAPVNPTATVGTPNASTGVVTGTVKATDPDGNPLTYTTPASTTKGTVTITTAGAFTYTPTAAARHAAAAVNAPAATTQDTFTVTISDGLGGTITKAVTVPVLGKNTAPTGYANVGWPDGTTGVVTGYVSAGDADYDPLTFSAANTAKGTVTVTPQGSFTYTPTAAARHAAAAVNAPAAAKQDTFTIAVKDGYGGTTNVNVTVTIVGKNTAPTNPTATVGSPNAATGVVTGTVGATDADRDTFTFTTPATTTKGSVTITSTGAFTYTPTAAARLAAAVTNAPAIDKQDTFTVTISDGYGGTVTKAVTVTVLGKANAAPINPTATVGTPNASTGVVTGTVKATDPDGNTLTYTAPSSTAKGTVTITTAGAFTYTPTAAAQHAAAAVNAPSAAKEDTFTVTISDGYGGTITKPVTVTVLGKNTAPTGYANVGWPDGTTGVVTGYVSAGDADYDALTFSTTNTAKGTVTVNTAGGFTYTPTAAARHAAAAVNAPASAKQDTFTVAVKDGYGGTTNVNVTVTIVGKNTAPNATATVTNTNLRTGVATGAITVADPDDSTFTYTATTSTKGSLAIAPNGSFTYTPTLAAQQAATGPNATAAAKQDTFNITVDDGYGGRATAVLNVAVTPIGANSPITDVKTTVGQPNSAIGEVKGTVKAVDPEGDVLTYTLTSGPTKGSVTVDSATGAFTYTPTSEARYDATVGPGQVVDSFTVTVRDAFGASASATVTAVPVAPYSASAIDQRPTSVGVSDPYLYFASQAETDHILDTLHASGIDTVRILVPWAGVEPVDNTYNWTAIDRMVTSARARNMTIVATLNSTPDWAVTPGTPAIIGAPANPQQYADFAGAVAARYVGRISAYEIWNEPNGKIFWEPGPDAAQYTAILKPAYLAIKAADPNATVVAGSVGYIATEPGKNINAVEFIQQMYANGAAGYFDAIAFHPYQYSYPFSVPDPYQVGPRSEAEKIHQLMVANGDGAKLIWATEYGQPTNFEGGVDRQAQFLADFLRTWREIDYAGPAYLFTTRDGTYSDPVENSFGLYNADWSPKPAVDAVEEVIDENDALDERNL